MLILVVVVGVALGIVYQFNDAFKIWANNYFGEYVACLLETGELPAIEGAPGSSGICDQMFKSFSLAEGRAPKGNGGNGGSKDSRDAGEERGEGGSRNRGGGGNGSPGAEGGGGSGGSFGRTRITSQNPGGSTGGGRGRGSKSNDTYTGSTAAGSYGQQSRASTQRGKQESRQLLSTKFAFEEGKEDKETRRSISSSKAEAGKPPTKSRLRINSKDLSKDRAPQADDSFTFGDWLRILIIIALIVGLVVTLGGQFLQIGKSNE